MNHRFEDWPSRLAAAIDAARRMPFGYGEAEVDCCRFPADAVAAMTGIDHMAALRGYRTRAGAYRAIRRYGGGGLSEAMDRWAAETGVTEIRPAMAGRGDVVMHETPEGPGLGICIGARFAAVTEAGGLVFLPMSAAVAAWRL